MSAEDMRPVFVIGMNGSGTTMLADSLGRHPSLYMFPYESKVIPLFLQRPLAPGFLEAADARRRLLEEIIGALPFWRAEGFNLPSLPDELLVDCRTVSAVFDALLRYLAKCEGKEGWIEKSPGNTEHVTLLATHFPTARFLHIVRDGRDAAQSFHRRWWFDPVHTIWRWKHVVRLGCMQGNLLGPTRYLQLSYEDLTADPEGKLRQVCTFLGLPFRLDILGSSMRYIALDERQSGKGRIVANSAKWQAYFTPRMQRRLEEVAGLQMAEMGYKVSLLGDRELGSIELRALRVKDAVMRSLAFFKMRGISSLLLFTRVARSAWQARSARRF